MQFKYYKCFDFITGIFAVSLVVSNILSASKIFDTGLTIFETPLVFDAGALLFPLCYILGDVVTEVYGYRMSRRMIWIGFFSMLLASFAFYISGILPAETFWDENVGQDNYMAVLGGVSSGVILLASLSAYIVGEFVNSMILAKMKVKSEGKNMPKRLIFSSLIGQALDTGIFVAIATVMGLFPAEIFVSLFLANYILKVGVEGVMTPVTKFVANRIKKIEGIDVYDRDISFNPFKL